MVLKIYRWIMLIGAVFSMAFIFYNSGQNAEKSSGRSENVSKIVAETVVPGFKELPPEEQKTEVKKIEAPLREIAHGCEFAMLAFFVFGFGATFCRTGKEGRLIACAASLLFCFLYALSDEWHQTFVDGRAAEWFDIGMDTIGSVAGILCSALLYFVIGRIRAASFRKKGRNVSSKAAA